MICSGSRKVEDADDAPVGVRESRDRPEQGGLPGPVRAEQGDHLALRYFQVEVEEHLVRAVVEVEVVYLQGRYLPAGLATFALGVALDHIFDDQRDVTAHAV
jgi:hypothetical protein